MTVKYTSDHEWIQLEDHEAAVVGITLHAQDALGDVVFVDLPEVGPMYAKGEVGGGVGWVRVGRRGGGESVGVIVWIFGTSEAAVGARRSDGGTGPDHRLRGVSPGAGCRAGLWRWHAGRAATV